MTAADSLLERFMERQMARQRARQYLQRKKDYLSARLRSAAADQRAALKQRLDALLADLGKARAAMAQRHITADLDEILQSPKRYPSLEHVTLRLYGMGLLHRGDGDASVHSLHFTALHGRDRRRWTVVMVHCQPRPEFLSMADRLQQAGRWLQL